MRLLNNTVFVIRILSDSGTDACHATVSSATSSADLFIVDLFINLNVCFLIV